MIFKDPTYLFFLLVIPVAFFFFLKRKTAALRYSSVDLLKGFPDSWRTRLRLIPSILFCASAVLFVIALARPQKGIEETKIETEGIDMVLAVDVSGSMLAEDFVVKGKYANRLEVVKKTVEDFIEGRAGDRIGLVLFAGRPYSQCPLTLDYGVLRELLKQAKVGMIEDGTAIGSALATCVNRLKETKAESKVVILLTDGMNNAGNIDPLTAATVAKTYGIKVYTIGAGSRGMARYPVQDFFGNRGYQPVKIPIDEKILRQISSITGGKSYRATDTESLQSIYDEINELEKTKVEVNIYIDYKELFPYFLIPGLLCLLAEIILSNTILRKLP